MRLAAASAALVSWAVLVIGPLPAANSAFPGENGMIAYTRSLSHNQAPCGAEEAIWVADSDGSNSRRTPVYCLNQSADRNPAWSPDGREIAFERSRIGGRFDVWIMAPDGTGERQLTPLNQSNEGEPTWQPGGNLIAFTSDRDGNHDIYAIESNGRGPELRLTNHPAEDRWPAWSPDGQWIAFASNRDPSTKDPEVPDLWAMRTDGTSVTRLTKGGGQNPRWSPDGTAIVYMAPGGYKVVDVARRGPLGSAYI